MLTNGFLFVCVTGISKCARREAEYRDCDNGHCCSSSFEHSPIPYKLLLANDDW